MRLRLTVAAIAATAVSGGAGWALAGAAPAHHAGVSPAQQAARARLVEELATYGCSCGHRPNPLIMERRTDRATDRP